MTTPPVLPPVLGAHHLCPNLSWKEVIAVKKQIVYVGKPYTVDNRGLVLKVWDKKPTTKELEQLAKESK